MTKHQAAYKRLILDVFDIDPEAAEYLKRDAIKLADFGGGGSLICAFPWRSTPQGHEYWSNIYKQLRYEP